MTYAAPRATKTDPTQAFEDLVEPMQMRIDDPAVVAAQIWRAVAQDLDSAYAKGPERLFVLIQRFAAESSWIARLPRKWPTRGCGITSADITAARKAGDRRTSG